MNNFRDCQQSPLEALNNVTRYNNTSIKVFLLKDFHNFLNDISINRKLKNLTKYLQENNQYLILSGNKNTIGDELKSHVKCLIMPLPNQREILKEIRNFTHNSKTDILRYQETIAKLYSGFTLENIRRSIAELIVQQVSAEKVLEKILEQKKEMIKNKEGIEFYSPTNLNWEIGGLNNLKKWLEVKKFTFTREAYSYGITMPKGLLLVGIQGTGKSLSAKVIATEWKLPLFRLDISKIFAGILGESENKIQSIIDICIQNAPCILWIDEIDKVFNEYNQTNDSGTKQRVTNIFLTWLSEKKEEVFIIATANTTYQLPIELLRKGRFDEIFFVDLPNFKERLQIFYIHIKKVRPATWNQYNIYYLSYISKGFSGAEIEQSVIDAMCIAFYEFREFTTRDIIRTISETLPLSITEKDKVLSLRKWGHSGKTKIA